ncbi:MAG: hypothetical protein EP323_00730 [Gammaproteobacteria bacterium]|nr:MAG: hypothetical protein EP323_00730 [Gammaproteobacteria bacterium]
MSLIPEKPLVISPSLAATIGLEEAILLQTLGEVRSHHTPEAQGDHQWLTTSASQLLTLLPFWQLEDIQRITSSLRDKGVLLVASAPLRESAELRFAFNERQANVSCVSVPPVARSTKTISPDWRPEEDVIRQLAQYSIPKEFCSEQIPEFVTYWTERGEPRYSWGSRFIKHVLRLWRSQQTEDARRSQEIPMSRDWQPSRDALEILTRQAGINSNFVEDAIPEFVLYWMERGESSSTWNSRFIMHVKRQWARFTSAMEHDTLPKPLAANWRPSEELFDVLTLANIPRPFAEGLVAEFVLYWRESGQLYGSWNTKFLQQVKRAWSRQSTANNQDALHGQQQRPHRPDSTRTRTLVDELQDRSWAST